MKTLLDEKVEKIKSKINATAAQSEEVVKGFINGNKKQLDTVVNSNKKIVNSVKEKFNEQDIDDTMTCGVKHIFDKSVELAEGALDSIINSYTKQMEYTVGFNTKLVDAIKELNSRTPEKILNLVQENFEASHQLTINNTKEMLDFYNKHTNLAVNFNKKFGDIIDAQMETLFSVKNNGLNKFTEWTSEWWKQTDKEVKI